MHSLADIMSTVPITGCYLALGVLVPAGLYLLSPDGVLWPSSWCGGGRWDGVQSLLPWWCHQHAPAALPRQCRVWWWSVITLAMTLAPSPSHAVYLALGVFLMSLGNLVLCCDYALLSNCRFLFFQGRQLQSVKWQKMWSYFYVGLLVSSFQRNLQ